MLAQVFIVLARLPSEILLKGWQGTFVPKSTHCPNGPVFLLERVKIGIHKCYECLHPISWVFLGSVRGQRLHAVADGQSNPHVHERESADNRYDSIK